MDDGNEYTNGKGTKNFVIKRILKFNHYKKCLYDKKPIIQLQQRFKSEAYIVYTEEINKMALGNDDDKRLQVFNNIITYSFGTNAFKVCESEMLSKYK